MAHILVVDDDDALRSLIEDALRDDGYGVTTCGSGAAALAWLAQHPADLVLCDQQMPGMTGDELCRQLHSTPHGHARRIIMMSGASETAFRGTCRYNGFLAKPFGLDHLSAAIAAALTITH